MKCICCGGQVTVARGTDATPICDLCRDENPFAADRARLIAAAGDPIPEEDAELNDPPWSSFEIPLGYPR